AAMNGHAKKEAHREQQHAELKETYHQIREQLPEQQAHWANWSDEELLQRAVFFFPHDGKRGEKSRHVQEQDCHQAGQKEIRRTRIGIEKNFRAHLHRERGVAVGQDAAERFIEADGGGDVYRLARHGRIGPVNQHQDLRAGLVQQPVGVIHGNLDPHAAPAGNNRVIEVPVVVDIPDQVKRVGILQTVEEFAAFAAPIGVVNDRVDLTDVRVDRITKQKHLQNRNDQGKEQRGEIAADMQGFLVKDGAETAE